ncbi:DUF979 domain-containing protein [Pseudoduganella sp. OTU4001]|uniref:DUF979 domain-containing protein n=1 Tax=Pseudoduganella sp. OTU4001 TaxID=3043854 RepID=UPI00313CB18C
MIVRVEYFYYLLGVMLALVALMSFADRSNPRRWTTGMFWALYATVYLAGERLPPAMVGLAMIVMALLAGFGGVRSGKPDVLTDEARRASAARLGHRLFIPALVIPAVTMTGATLMKDVRLGELFVLDQKHLTLVSLGCAAVVAVAVACWLTRATPLQAGREARRLVDAMSWALVLPHMLAVLGLLFSEAGVGKAVAQVAGGLVGADSKLAAVALYCIGMAVFTIVMGNGFAAFPVMAAGVGVPVLVTQYGGNPAVMAAIGMFSAYCGTLMTPMAANFNIIPAALLDLPDRNAVIKAQIPTALPLLGANIVLLYFLL